MRYIDTHAHYNDEVYKDNLEEVLSKVLNSNVNKIINVGCSVKDSKDSIDLSKKYDYIYSTVGIHPSYINEDVSEIEELLLKNNEGKIVAIGETGLDYKYGKDNKEEQIELFIKQIKLAKKYNLPIIVHSRDASLDTYNVIKDNVSSNTKLLFHCFAPTDDLVKLAIERKYFVAFGGNITYPRNESFKKYIQMIPIDQIVIETDSPYLSPVPYRGKVNDSSNLDIICRKLAEFKLMEEDEIADIVYENSIRFFRL